MIGQTICGHAECRKAASVVCGGCSADLCKFHHEHTGCLGHVVNPLRRQLRQVLRLHIWSLGMSESAEMEW